MGTRPGGWDAGYFSSSEILGLSVGGLGAVVMTNRGLATEHIEQDAEVLILSGGKLEGCWGAGVRCGYV